MKEANQREKYKLPDQFYLQNLQKRYLMWIKIWELCKL